MSKVTFSLAAGGVEFRGSRTAYLLDTPLLDRLIQLARHGGPGEMRCSINRCTILIADDDRYIRDGIPAGTGLGLNISQKIIELHNGSLSFASEVGKGTVFTISL